MFLILGIQSPNLAEPGPMVPEKNKAAMSKVPLQAVGQQTPSGRLKMAKATLERTQSPSIVLDASGFFRQDGGSIEFKLHLCATPNNIGRHEVLPRTPHLFRVLETLSNGSLREAPFQTTGSPW